MAKIVIEVPDDIDHYSDEFEYFVKSMLKKLYINRHKGFAEGLEIPESIDLIEAELVELRESLSSDGPFEAFFEAIDVANTAFIVGLVVTRMTRKDYNDFQAKSRAS